MAQPLLPQPHRLPVYLMGLGVVGPFGRGLAAVAATLAQQRPALAWAGAHQAVVGALPQAEDDALATLARGDRHLRGADRAALLATLALADALHQAQWPATPPSPRAQAPLWVGTSRGATGTTEQALATHLAGKRLGPRASPWTTPASLAHLPARVHQLGGPAAVVSATCASALVALAQAIVALQARGLRHALVAATEAPLTPLTLAAMQGVGVYTPLAADAYPCRPWATDPAPTFALAEGAAALALTASATPPPGALAQLEAVGLGQEHGPTLTAPTPQGDALAQACLQALAQLPDDDRQVDLVLLHATGTAQGDAAERHALQTAFPHGVPYALPFKHLTGHPLGAAGGWGLAMALAALQGAPLPAALPYPALPLATPPTNPRRALVLATGFGGTAAALSLRLP